MPPILLIGNISLETTVRTDSHDFNLNAAPESNKAAISDEIGGCVLNLSKVFRQIGWDTQIIS
jgi:hypothetical protein